MNNDMTGFLTGLSQGLNSYLGQQNETRNKVGLLNYQNQLETQRDEKKSAADLQKEMSLKLYEQTIAGKIDPDTAATIAPDAAKWVTEFNEYNKRMPTGQEFKEGYIGAAKGSEGDEKQQDKLEKEGREILQRALRSREAPGQELTKLHQAIHIQQMVNEATDPKTGEVRIPPSMHAEMALSMARMLGGGGQPSENLVEELRQKTAREGLAGLAIYMGADPKKVGGPTQNVAKMFMSQIERQAKTSQHLVRGYVEDAKKLLPSRLSAERRKLLLDAEIGPDFANYIEGGKYANIGAHEPTDGAKPVAHPQDNEAVAWAKANPKDPRSAQILKANGL